MALPGTEKGFLSILVAGREVDRLLRRRKAEARRGLQAARLSPFARRPYGKGRKHGARRGRFCSRRATTRVSSRFRPRGDRRRTSRRSIRSRRENSHRFPQFLPDGRHFVFLVRVSGEGAADELMVGSLDGAPPRPLMKAVANAMFVSGRLLYVRDRALVARRFDPERMRLEGEEVVIGDDVHVLPAVPLAVFSASRTGTLVYDRGSGSPTMALRWFDRGGREEGSVGETGLYYEFALSRDDRRIALSTEDPKTGRLDVFILDVERGMVERLTSGKTDSSMPLGIRTANVSSSARARADSSTSGRRTWTASPTRLSCSRPTRTRSPPTCPLTAAPWRSACPT